MKDLWLPDEWQKLSVSDALPKVRVNERKCVLYGGVVGYRFVHAPDQSTVLDVQCSVVKQEPGMFWPESIKMPAEEEL